MHHVTIIVRILLLELLMSQSTKNILQSLSSGKPATNTVETGENPVNAPSVSLNKSPELSMSDVLANCLAPRKGDPNLTPL